MTTVKVISKVVQEVSTERTALSLSKEQLAIVNEFFETRTMVNDLTKRQKALEAEVKEIIGDHEVGVFDDKVRIEQSFRSREGLDTEKLKTAFPEAYEACQTKKPYVVLVAK